jgi:hypothetical protein
MQREFGVSTRYRGAKPQALSVNAAEDANCPPWFERADLGC